MGHKATSIARPGEMYVPHTVAGVAKGCVFVVDRNAQIRVFDAETGLYAGSLLDDIYQGVMPDQNTLALTHELVQAQVLEHPRLGQTYLIVGDYSGPRCYQVTGLEAIEHFSSPVTVTTPAAPRELAAAADDRLRPQRKTLVIPPAPANMIIDGRLDEWNQDTAVELAADPQRKDLRGRCLAAWDRDFLYVAYDVEDSSPMRNAGDDPSMAFKTSDTCISSPACRAATRSGSAGWTAPRPRRARAPKKSTWPTRPSPTATAIRSPETCFEADCCFPRGARSSASTRPRGSAATPSPFPRPTDFRPNG